MTSTNPEKLSMKRDTDGRLYEVKIFAPIYFAHHAVYFAKIIFFSGFFFLDSFLQLLGFLQDNCRKYLQNNQIETKGFKHQTIMSRRINL